jgi:predicted molibdopterin-dependent oxidoreductase YjgC
MVVKKSICLNCSLGCGLAFRQERGEVMAIDYDQENPVNHGSICTKGYFNLDLLNSPKRLTKPAIGGRQVSWEAALDNIRRELTRYQGKEIGIALSCFVSNEAAAAAVKLAENIGTKNIYVAGDPADLGTFYGDQAEGASAKVATLEELEQAETILIIGDIIDRTPVLAKRINKVKYGKRGNRIILIDENETHTSWFATTQIKYTHGAEGETLANFKELINGVVVYVPSFDIVNNDQAVKLIKKIPCQGYQIYYRNGNTAGVCSIIKNTPIDQQKIKVLISFGADLPTADYQFVVRAAYFPNPEWQLTDNIITLPLASHLETGGTFTLTPGRSEKVEPIVQPVGSKSVVEIAQLIAG